MKIFVTILVASSLALATADISLKQNYNYNGNNIPQTYYSQQQQQQLPQQQQQQQQQPQYTAQNIIPNSFLKPNTQYLPQSQSQQVQPQLLPLQQNQRYVGQQKQQQQSQFPMPSDFPSMFSFQPAVKTSNRRYRPRVRIPKKPIITKNFFIHSAPEETEAEIEEELAAVQQQPRKHYNVLFVKTPSQTNKAAALNLAKALKEEKTVVYVLAKKTSAADLQDAIQEAPQHVNKPEVFFIKYRTPEEAANAQRQIQSQYDSLGGSTTISDEGIAPSTSVIGSLEAPSEEEDEEQQQQELDNSPEQQQTQSSSHSHYDDQQVVNNLQTANNGYLPPSNQF